VLGTVGLPESDAGGRLSTLWGLLRRGVSGTAETPLNKPIGPHRRVDWLRFELAAVKAVKQRLGGTVNDVVLATVAGALRTFLLKRDFDVQGVDFRTIVPVSMRSSDERGVPGNRVSVWMTSLPIDEADPRRRYASIRETTSRSKASHEADGAAMLTQTADWTTSLVLGLAVRLLNRSRAFNLVVTNVPGPPVPLYLLDAPMVAAYPHVPLFENQGLGIALFSYAEHLYWGLVGDWDVVPDLHALVEYLGGAFTELAAAAGVEARAPAVGRRAAAHRNRDEHAHEVA
jgi:WS/DGAT/MGAT family acyltransferase